MGTPSCTGCRQCDQTIAVLRQRLRAAQARIRQLEAQLGRNASNSSVPPSANPLNAPKLSPKKASGRPSGGQPGHPVHLRRRLPPERLQHLHDFVPSHRRRCRELLAVEEALWTFVRTEGVEPTNNHIERLLRPAVLWRKRSFGSQSEAGRRWVERLLTVVQTRRLQGRPVLDYLYEAVVAHRAGLPAPRLLYTA